MKNQATNPNDLLNTPQASALLKNKDAIRQIAQSPDTQKLLQMLNAQNGGGLKAAAEQAGKGDPKALVAMVNGLMQSKEGAELVERLNKTMPK